MAFKLFEHRISDQLIQKRAELVQRTRELMPGASSVFNGYLDREDGTNDNWITDHLDGYLRNCPTPEFVIEMIDDGNIEGLRLHAQRLLDITHCLREWYKLVKRRYEERESQRRSFEEAQRAERLPQFLKRQ